MAVLSQIRWFTERTGTLYRLRSCFIGKIKISGISHHYPNCWYW